MNAWSRHPYRTAVVLAAGVGSLISVAPAETSAFRSGDGAALYTAVVTAATALAALGIVPISIVLGLSSPRVKALTREKSADLRRTVALAVCWHFLTIVVSVGLLGFDSSLDPLRFGRVASVTLMVLGVEATLRAVVEFLAMLRLEAETAQVMGEPTPLPDDWVETMDESRSPDSRDQ